MKDDDSTKLICHIIPRQLHAPLSLLMGPKVVDEKFRKTAIGCKDKAKALVLTNIIETSHF